MNKVKPGTLDDNISVEEAMKLLKEKLKEEKKKKEHKGTKK